MKIAWKNLAVVSTKKQQGACTTECDLFYWGNDILCFADPKIFFL